MAKTPEPNQPEAEMRRPPILALHGFTGSGLDFEPFRAVLPRQLFTPDLPGHAETFIRAEAPNAFNEVVDGVARQLDGPTLVWGYSMGGRIGLSLALRHPDLVSRLILVGASPGLAQADERSTREDIDVALARRVRKLGTRAFLKEWSQHPLIATQTTIPNTLRAPMLERRAVHNPEGLAYSLEVMGTGAMPPLWTKLPQLKCPTLAVFGERDEKFAGIAMAMQRIQPSIQPICIEGAGHCAHLENMDGFLTAVRDFLTSPE